MLCENKIRPQFNFCIIITRTVLSTFVLPSLKALVLFEGLVFSLKVTSFTQRPSQHENEAKSARTAQREGDAPVLDDNKNLNNVQIPPSSPSV